jgi:hypothetical protein
MLKNPETGKILTGPKIPDFRIRILKNPVRILSCAGP